MRGTAKTARSMLAPGMGCTASKGVLERCMPRSRKHDGRAWAMPRG